MSLTFKFTFFLLVSTAFYFQSATVSAQSTLYWQPSQSPFSIVNPNNWSPPLIPSGNDLIFRGGPPALVDFSGTLSVQDIEIHESTLLQGSGNARLDARFVRFNNSDGIDASFVLSGPSLSTSLFTVPGNQMRFIGGSHSTHSLWNLAGDLVYTAPEHGGLYLTSGTFDIEEEILNESRIVLTQSSVASQSTFVSNDLNSRPEIEAQIDLNGGHFSSDAIFLGQWEDHNLPGPGKFTVNAGTISSSWTSLARGSLFDVNNGNVFIAGLFVGNDSENSVSLVDLEDSDVRLGGLAINPDGVVKIDNSQVLVETMGDFNGSVILSGRLDLENGTTVNIANDLTVRESVDSIAGEGIVDVNESSLMVMGDINIGDLPADGKVTVFDSFVSADNIFVNDGTLDVQINSTVEINELSVTDRKGDVEIEQATFEAARISLSGGPNTGDDDDFAEFKPSGNITEVDVVDLLIGRSPEQFPHGHMGLFWATEEATIRATNTVLEKDSILALQSESKMTTENLTIVDSRLSNQSLDVSTPLVIADGTLTVTNQISVESGGLEVLGELGNATLELKDDALANLDNLTVDSRDNSMIAEMLIFGSEPSVSVAGTAFIGRNGKGIMAQSAGRFEADRIAMAEQNGSQSTFVLAAGTLKTDLLDLGLAGSATFGLNGGSLFANTIRLNGPGVSTFNMNGGQLSVSTFFGDLVQANGTLTPGSESSETGVTDIIGSYAVNGGAISLQIGTSNFDSIRAFDVNLNNSHLDVEVLTGVHLEPGQSYKIIDVVDELNGRFDGYGEGAAVASLNGQTLFITYQGGDGNDVVLYTTRPSLVDRIGVHRGNRFILDNNGDLGFDESIDAEIPFGLAGDTPIVGDWNGDGISEIGVRRNNKFLLDFSGNGQFEPGLDYAITFGLVGDVPVVGDWNGDGFANIGVRRGDRFILDSNGDGSYQPGIDQTIRFGLSGDTPVVGDWDGDGVTELGVRRGRIFYLDMNGDGRFTPGEDQATSFGLASDRPVVGDWNGDGKTELGVRRNNVFFLDVNGDGAFQPGVDEASSYGLPGDTAIIGAWD